MAIALVTTQTIIARNAGALYNVAVGSTLMNQLVAQASVSTSSTDALLNQVYLQSVGTTPTTSVAATLIANLGITGATAIKQATDYIVATLNANSPSFRGAAVNDLLDLFVGLTNDANFGAAATAYNAKVANAEAYALVAGNVANGDFGKIPGVVDPTIGHTFSLTTGQDYADITSAFKNGGLLTTDFKFTAGNEIVTAGAGTLGNTDALIDGSTVDADVLNATLTSGAVATTTIQNIETLNLTSTITGSGLSFANVLGAKTVTLTGTANTTLSNVNSNAAPAIAVNNFNKVLTLDVATLAGTTAAGTADALTVKVSGLTAGGTTATPIIAGLTLTSGAAGNLETLNLESAGTTKNTLDLVASTNVSAITKTVLTGAADLDLRVAHTLITGQTLDASGHTAVLNLIVDRNGATTAATNLTNVTGVETYTFRDSTAGTDILVASGLADASAVVITESFGGANSLSVKGAASSTTNVLNVTLDHVTDATNVAIGTGLTITDVETINFKSEGGTTAGNSIVGLAVNAGSKVSIDGATKLDLQLAVTSLVTTVEVKGAGAHKVDFAGAATYAEAKNLTIDGSTATGKLTLDGSDFRGTAGGVIETLTIKGGTTDDTITGTSGDAFSKNVIDAGAGVDTVNLATANNSNVTLGAGADKLNITGVTGAGSITITDFALGTGGDVLSVDTVAAVTLGANGAVSVSNQLIVITAAVANAAAAAALVSAGAAAEAAIIVINSATGFAELWYDADGTAGGELMLASFENITTVGVLTDAVAGFTAANFGTWV